jgi:integrase
MGLGKDEQFIFHVCRHTNLTRLSEQGMQPKAIQEWAGHQDLKTTMRYIHPSKLHLESGANMMSMYDFTPKTFVEPTIKNDKLSLVEER